MANPTFGLQTTIPGVSLPLDESGENISPNSLGVGVPASGVTGDLALAESGTDGQGKITFGKGENQIVLNSDHDGTWPMLVVSGFVDLGRGYVRPHPIFAVSQLYNPAIVIGAIMGVNNALTPVIGSAVVGGGAAFALVVANGSQWTVIGV